MNDRMNHWIIALVALLFVGVMASVPRLGGEPPPTQSVETPRRTADYVDDFKLEEDFIEKLGALAKKGKCLPTEKLKKLTENNRAGDLQPVKSVNLRYSPDDLYEKIKPSVFLIGSVTKDDDGELVLATTATAWALSADGLLVTNWHLFDGVEKLGQFGAMDHKGEVFPLTDVVAINKTADVAVVRVEGKGFNPLPLAKRPAPIGSWVGVLGHPAGMYYHFSTGSVSRYSKYKPDDAPEERWMSITAEFAYGSSGSPVLNSQAEVVGMAALTEAIDYPDESPAKPKEGEKVEPKNVEPKKTEPKKMTRRFRPLTVVRAGEAPVPVNGSPLQMVVKLAVPLDELRHAIVGEPR